MKKLVLVMASVAGLGFAAPSFASDVNASQGRIQLAQAGVSISVGTPAPRGRVVVRERHRHHHHGWRHHNARADKVIIVKKKKYRPARKTVIIDRR
jgi:hypothetical protein